MSQSVMIHKPRILIADDEEFNRLLLTRILEREYEIDLVANGQEVLDHLMKRDYDAILLDIMMPKMNGIEALQAIRKELDLTTLPVILVSAMSDNDTIVKGMDLGANDFIPKPVDPRVVLARLRTQIQLKRLTDERLHVMEALEEANELKLRMMQIASHDLKNPLNNLSMLMTVLTDTVGNQPHMPRLMSIANQSIDMMTNIIDDFLNANKFLSSGVDVQIEAHASHDILSEVLAQHAMAAEQKSIVLDTSDVHDGLIAVDKARTMQVLNNLISNAIKYTPSGGRVTLHTMIDDMTWRLEVHDSGPGIPPEERQYLFQAFSKNHISTKPTNGESSTGLGLWIAAEMMRLQEGVIGMDSPPQGGCCFWIELPLATEMVTVSA